MTASPRSLAAGALSGLAVAAVFFVVAEVMEVPELPAVVGALVGASIELGAFATRRAPVPAGAGGLPAGPAAGAHLPPQHVAGQAWSAGTPTPGAATAATAPPAAPAPPAALAASTIPPGEVACHTCGLYPADAPDPRSFPQPGSVRQFGPG